MASVHAPRRESRHKPLSAGEAVEKLIDTSKLIQYREDVRPQEAKRIQDAFAFSFSLRCAGVYTFQHSSAKNRLSDLLGVEKTGFRPRLCFFTGRSDPVIACSIDTTPGDDTVDDIPCSCERPGGSTSTCAISDNQIPLTGKTSAKARLRFKPRALTEATWPST